MKTKYLFLFFFSFLLSPLVSYAQLRPPRLEVFSQTRFDDPPFFESSDEAPFNLFDLKGLPLILVPAFTSCPHVCPTLTQKVVTTLHEINSLHQLKNGQDYRVLVFSFDSKDQRKDITQFKEKITLQTSEGWLFARITKNLNPFLEQLDFLTLQTAPRQFSHVSGIYVLSSGLSPIQFITETNLTSHTVYNAYRDALKAESPNFLIRKTNQLWKKLRPYFGAFSLIGFLVTALITSVLWVHTRRTLLPRI